MCTEAAHFSCSESHHFILTPPPFLPYHTGMTKPTHRPVGRPKGSGVHTARIELRLRPALAEQVRRAAAEDGVTVAYFLRRAVVSSIRWRTRRAGA